MAALKFFYLETCDSTQNEVFHIFDRDQSSPFVVIAQEQKAGRGRLQRQWVMEKGSSLALSLGWKSRRRDLSGLSLLVGMSIQHFLNDPSIKVKWPNDLMLMDQKIGGVLIETKTLGDHVYLAIGIGVNLFSVGPYQGLGREIDPAALASFLVSRLESFENIGFAPFQSQFEEILWKKSEKILFRNFSGERLFEICGVDRRGALILDGEGRLSIEISGEIVHEG
jgi:BirA family biotin operon repressor/biotin-[acetyl-CoA-carboxylase] ligase